MPVPIYYVYTLSKPDRTVFYVGKGTKNKGRYQRFQQHYSEAKRGKQSYKCNVIRKIWASGNKVVETVCHECSNEQDALDFEIKLIASLSGLTNKTSGGEGLSGFTHSSLTRSKIAQGNTGKIFTAERCAKISKATTGIPKHMPESWHKSASSKQQGELKSTAKITEKQALEIIALRSQNISCKAISEKFGLAMVQFGRSAWEKIGNI